MPLAFILALALQTAPAASAPLAIRPTAGDAAAAKPGYDPEKIVCKLESVRGQRILSKTCRKQSEWDSLSAGGEAYLRQVRGNAAPSRGY